VENTYIESFNGRLRDECLNVEMFVDLADAQLKIEMWRRDYNEQRPHGALAVRGARLSDGMRRPVSWRDAIRSQCLNVLKAQ
jgi:transposase InsO family protein